MILEISGKTVEVQVTAIINGYIKVESAKGLGLFHLHTGKGRFLTGSKNILALFKRGVQINLRPVILELLRKELE